MTPHCSTIRHHVIIHAPATADNPFPNTQPSNIPDEQRLKIIDFCRDAQDLDRQLSRSQGRGACCVGHGRDAIRGGGEALAVFRTEGWVEEIGKGMTSLRITVTNQTVTHEVRMQEFENWLKQSNGSPAEMVAQE